jgi:subtilisin family serine protease
MSARRTFKLGNRLLPLIAAVAAFCIVSGPSDPALAQDHAQWASGRTDATTPSAAYVPGQALVLFRSGTSMSGARASANGAEASVKRQVPRCWVNNGSRLMVVRSSTLSTSELIAALEADPAVVYAEPDYIRQPDVTPNDPQFGELWGMQKIAATQAWNLTTGAAGVVVADIDSGAAYNHPDLAANMWKNPGEFGKTPGVDDDDNGYVDDVYGVDGSAHDVDPMDDDADSGGHGTHTAGTIGAAGDNGIGVTGVSWTVRLMPLKFFGGEDSGSISAEIECINYAIWQKQHGVNVVAINASFGSPDPSQAERDAVQAAGNAGIVWVAAAGNGGDDGLGDDNDATPEYPAGYDCTNIIAVAASDQSDALSYFSNYGAATVDLAAPGEDILSTVPTAIDPSGYVSYPGTSMATPHVTGAIALCAAQFPGDTLPQRMARVLEGVDKVSALAGKCAAGGRLNVAKALGITPVGGAEPFNLQSSTHPAPDTWYASRSAGFSWEGPPDITLASYLGWVGNGSGIYVTDIDLAAEKAYLATTFGGLRIVDVSDPRAPAELGGLDDDSVLGKGGLSCVAVNGDFAYVGCDGWIPYGGGFQPGWLHVLDVADPGDVRDVSYLSWDLPDTQICSATVAGDNLYVVLTATLEGDTSASAFLLVFSLSDPGWPKYVSDCWLGWRGDPFFYTVFDNPWKKDMILRDGLLYIGGWELHVVDVHDPTAPALLSSAYDPKEGSCNMGVALSGGYAFSGDDPDAAREGDLDIFDVSDPAAAQFVRSFTWKQPNGSFTMDKVREVVAADEDPARSKHYLLAGWNNTPWDATYVNLLDVTEPHDPVNLGPIETPDDPTTSDGDWKATELSVQGEWLYGGCRDADYEFAVWHLGPTAYSYLLDQNPVGTPDTSPEGLGGGLAGSTTVTAPHDGVWYFHVRARDDQGVWGPTVTRKVQIDGTAPTVTTNADTSPHRFFTLVLTANDGSGSGVVKVEYRIDGSAWKTGEVVYLKCYGKRRTYSVGTHTVEYRATDVAGNVGQTGSCQVKLAL